MPRRPASSATCWTVDDNPGNQPLQKVTERIFWQRLLGAKPHTRSFFTRLDTVSSCVKMPSALRTLNPAIRVQISVGPPCRVRKGTGSPANVILNKEVRAGSGFIWVCEAAIEASGSCITGHIVFLPYMCWWVCLLRVFRYS